jgi:superfamily II DNA or RNA helicase
VKRPTLYEHQRLAVEQAHSHIKEGENAILIVAPTGSGKTVIASEIMFHEVRVGRRCLFLVHRSPLIDQTSKTAAKFGLRTGVIKSGYPEDRAASVQIASVQTLTRRNIVDYPEADLVICDEAHTSYSLSWRKILDFYKMRGATVIGLTATAYRTNPSEGLGEVYNKIVQVASVAELVQQKLLATPIYFGIPARLDLSKVRMRGKDFDVKDLNIVCNIQTACSSIVDQWEKKACDRLTIGFTVSTEHSDRLMNEFTRRGYYAATVDYRMSEDQRDEIMCAFSNGKVGNLQILLSVDVLEEGFDVPAVGCVIQARPTWSRKKNEQQIGRGLRKSSGKENCIILDCAGNAYRFGFITDKSKLSLNKDNPDKRTGIAPVKECSEIKGGCGALIPISSSICSHCGYIFPTKKKLEPKNLVPLRGREECSNDEVDYYRLNANTAYRKEQSPGLAISLFEKKFNYVPHSVVTKGAVFGENPSDQQRKMYRAYLQRIAFKQGKDLNWIMQFMELEFG